MKLLCVLSLLCTAAFAAPIAESLDVAIEAEKNVTTKELVILGAPPGSKANPKDAFFEISGWWELAEMDCYAMLCLGKGTVFKKGPGTKAFKKDNRRKAGVLTTPFQTAQLSLRHTSQITSQTTSAEEFPWASTEEGGSNAVVFPGTVAQQCSQGNGVKTGLNRANVHDGDYFRIKGFTNKGGGLGIYCAALFRNPPDTSVCRNDKDEDFYGKRIKIADYVYQVVTSAGAAYVFKHVAGRNNGKITKRTVGFPEIHQISATPDQEMDFDDDCVA